MRDKTSRRRGGFAFVKMSTDEETAEGGDRVQPVQMGGRSLTCNEARPKPEGGFVGGNAGVAAMPRAPVVAMKAWTKGDRVVQFT